MSLFGRIIVIAFALIVASMVAGITLAIGIVAPDWTGIDSDPVERVSFFIVSFFATSFIGAVAFLPALVVILFAEIARMRSFLYYGVGGALVGLASYFGSDISVRLENTTDVPPVGHSLQLAAAAGIIGGLAYWLIAGRNAGRWRERRLPAA
ncbi:MAG: hypothetical protein WBG10_08540 [Pseudolabrys sp.]